MPQAIILATEPRPAASLWEAVTPDLPKLPPLAGQISTDVAIVGGGFTGLAAALHLRRIGVDAVVVDAAEPGWGASGRNNGQIIPTLSRADPDDIVAMHGDVGERFVGLLRDSAQGLFDLVRDERLQAEGEQSGWVQPAHTPGRLKVAERRVAQWAKRGAPVELLDRGALARKLGSDTWCGGWWNRSGGHINPLALARSLTRAVIDRGGSVFPNSPVIATNRAGGLWVVTLPRARITSRALIIATNAYTGAFSRALFPDLVREVVPVRSWQMATQPLSAAVQARIMSERNAVSDMRGELFFARYDARGRIITGGAVVNQYNAAERLKPYVADRLQRQFPGIGDIAFDYVWNGFVGMTQDFMPRFHQIGRDGYAWVGCNGRAVALSLSIGRELARAATGTSRDELSLPFTEPNPIRSYGVARRAAPLFLVKQRWKDRREV